MKFRIALLIFFSLCLIALSGWRYFALASPRQAAEEYLRALAVGEAEKAALLASGAAAQAAARVESGGVQAQVKSIATSVSVQGRGWTRIMATVELTLQDDTPDVGWYVLDVARVQDAWKVVAFREAEPEMSGMGPVFGKEDAAGKVLQDYLEALAENRYADAGKFLVGPARKAHEAAAFALGKAPVIKEAGTVTLTPLWKRGKLLEARVDYRVDGRDASALVLFFRSSKGWKMAQIKQL